MRFIEWKFFQLDGGGRGSDDCTPNERHSFNEIDLLFQSVFHLHHFESLIPNESRAIKRDCWLKPMWLHKTH